MKRCLYYAPVKKKFFKKWEYYQVDLNILDELFDEVVVCHDLRGLICKIWRVDCVYCWWWHRSVGAILLSRMLQKFVVCTGAIHMFDQKTAIDFYGTKSWIFRVACRIALRLACKNIFISKDQKEAITSHIQTRNPTIVFSSISKNQKYDHHLKVREFEIENQKIDRKTCFRAGILTWLNYDQIDRKGVLESISAIKRLNLNKGDLPKLELVIAGEGGNAVDFLGKIQADNSSWLTLKTDLSSEEKATFFREIDFFINASSYEGFGNAALEALTFGVPVLTSRFGASYEVVGKAGKVVLSIDEESIEEGLVDLIDELLNNSSGLQQEIRRQVQNFSYERRLLGLQSTLFS